MDREDINMEDIKEKIIDEAKRIEEDSLYSSKGHLIAANFWRKCHLWLGIPSSILAAIAGGFALAKFESLAVLAGILAIIVTALTTISTFLNPNEKANCHLNSGNQFNELKNKSRIFYEIEPSLQSSDEELAAKLDELARRRDDLNMSSPQIPRQAYDKAKKSIEKGEADYTVDKMS